MPSKEESHYIHNKRRQKKHSNLNLKRTNFHRRLQDGFDLMNEEEYIGDPLKEAMTTEEQKEENDWEPL